MRVDSLCQSILLLSFIFAPILCSAADDSTATKFHVVGTGQCADCKDYKFKPSQAFSGLHVTIDCKLKNGDMKRVAYGDLDDQGEFHVPLPKEVVAKDGQKLKHECYAQLHSAAAIPCPVHSKIAFKSIDNGKHIFTPTKNLQFSASLCTSKFLWPHFKLPPLPKTHPWLKNFGHPWTLPPLHKPFFSPKPIYKPPVVQPLPPPVPVSTPPIVKPLPPPMPIYNPPVVKPHPPPVPVHKPPKKPCPPTKPQPPVYKPPVHKPPVYKPPKKPCPPTKPKPPVYKPPVHKPPVYKPPVYKPPVYKPPVHKPPVYKPPVYKPPVYKPPIYKPPIVKPLPPPIPIYKPPIVKPLPPPIPIYKPPIFKKPCPPLPFPPFPVIPPKYFKHPKFGHFPPLPPAIPQP